MSSIKEIVNLVVSSSNEFEMNNSQLKLQYLKNNIDEISKIFSSVSHYKGTFGTGYPFYCLDENLVGTLPIIEEQIRYNNELLNISKYLLENEWICKKCLMSNHIKMPDLKQLCLPCPNIDKNLKPRKIINRLPDIDLWIVCSDEKVRATSIELSSMFQENKMRTSDIDPMKTMYDIQQISRDINKGEMPNIYLPLDVHIVEEKVILDLLCKIYEEITYAHNNNLKPYLSIHPLSLRKIWQYDDMAYNFVSDYLNSLNLLNGTDEMYSLLFRTRKLLANDFDMNILYNIALSICGESHERRSENIELKNTFERKLKKWQQY